MNALPPTHPSPSRPSAKVKPGRRHPAFLSTSPLARRAFLQSLGAVAICGLLRQGWSASEAGTTDAAGLSDAEIQERIEAHRPSRLKSLPADFKARVGAAHVAGKYCLTDSPFLLEGAERLIALGTRLGKFWFMPDDPAGSYPFHSRWERYGNFVELAQSDYFRKVFEMPFATILLEAHTPAEAAWRKSGLTEAFYDTVTREFHALTAHLIKTYRDREITFVLQHWEGDWLLRGAGEKWNPPPADWKERCQRMQRWLAARQAGVSQARREAGEGARCVVAHAAEVNRVADAWEGIPTMTRHVLPAIELDLVSYSAYDGLRNPVHLWKCIAEIRKQARTGRLFGPGAMFIGEIGLPENEQPERIAERFDQWLGVAVATRAKYVAHWQLYCNEFAPKLSPKPKAPIADPKQVRGFWLVKPDGALSESGRYFAGLWQRAA